jgi:uncharacterized DUF497 family protein
MRFEWDEKKNQLNILKHKVNFKAASSVFNDKNSVVLPDENHSGCEERFYIIGLDLYFRELTVCHCYREDDVIRIISAWKATEKELNFYYGGKNL